MKFLIDVNYNEFINHTMKKMEITTQTRDTCSDIRIDKLSIRNTTCE